MRRERKPRLVHDDIIHYQVPPETWYELQHYHRVRDDIREPKWIKLYLKLSDNDEFFTLSETGRLQVITAWLLAGKFGNRIPDRGRAVERLNLSKKPMDFAALAEAGFLEAVEENTLISRDYPDSRVTLEQLYANSSLEREKEKEINPSVANATSVKEIFDYWAEKRNKQRSRLTENRRKKIRARLREFTSEELKRCIDGVALDPWEDRPRHDDLTIIFRSQEQVEKFLALSDDVSVMSREDRLRRHFDSLKERGVT
jgi:uncharacterized phage protein (TIGR02220 family)